MIKRLPEYLWVLGLLRILNGCSPASQADAEKTAQPPQPLYPTQTAALDGQQLAQAYCQACHLFPEPALLDKNTWQRGVLPNMALRLGLMPADTNLYTRMSMRESYLVQQAGVFADTARIRREDWNKIVAYYLHQAPGTPLPQAPKPAINPSLPHFKVNIPSFNRGHVPLITMVRFDTTRSLLYLGERNRGLFRLDAQGQLLDSFPLPSPPSDMAFQPDGSLRLLTMGQMDPSDEPLGQLLALSPQPHPGSQPQQLLDELPRPVHYASSDLNGDGREDLIICGFGNYVGRLAWYETLANGRYREHVIKNVPGARKAVVGDFDRDGLPDLMVLVAQATEGVFIYYNQGQGRFREEAVLRFPPVFGSSYFELADFNGDGAPDIVFTNGDNADYSYSLKNYHGVRLYLNDGNNQFHQAWFYPLHGATKAVSRDFDLDGDLDLAAISYFPDAAQKPNQGFVYFENRGGFHFQASSFDCADQGSWLTMEAADLDRDGDTDIVLGSFRFEWRNHPSSAQAREAGSKPSLVILENTRLKRVPH